MHFSNVGAINLTNMEKNKLEKIYFNFIFWALGFAFFSVFTSITALSLYHLLAFIPFTYFAIKQFNLQNKTQLVLIALICWISVATIFNFSQLIDPVHSFSQIKHYLFAFLGLYGVQEFIKNNNLTEKRKKILLGLLFGGIILATVIGYFKNFQHFNIIKWTPVFPKDKRISGITGIMRYGYGLSYILSIFSGYLLYQYKIKNNALNKKHLFLFIFCFVGFFLSYTRGAMLGFICSASMFFYFINKKIFLTVSAILSTGILLLAIISFSGGSESSRFLLKAKSGTNIKRLSQYQSALYAMKEKPIFGLGLSQLSNHIKRIKKKYNLKKKKYISHSHNIFLEMGANAGIPAMLLFILFFLFWFKDLLFHSPLIIKMTCIPAIVNIVISGIFEQTINGHLAVIIFTIYQFSYSLKEKN